MQKVRRRAAACAVALILLATAGCTGDGKADSKHSRTATIAVDKPAALADEAVHVRISGLISGEEVTVTTHTTDVRNMGWSGRAVFTADAKGIVDLGYAEPESGTYRGADAMGLFWSMIPAKGDPDQSAFEPSYPQRSPSYRIKLAVVSGGRIIAERLLTRTWTMEGVRHKTLTVAKDKLRGELFLPPTGGPRKAPVLLLGGSEGGVTVIKQFMAALLASRGHPALALCYFNCQGRPQNLAGISLDYFATAARYLRGQPQADARRLAVIGVSRGSEAAQLMAQYYPELVQDAVVYAPSRNTNGAYPTGCCGTGRAAWTKDGKELNLIPIPLNHVRGTVLAVAGGDDRLWGSLSSAESIAQERGATGHLHRALLYPKAGHGIGSFPYLPFGVGYGGGSLGGTRAANARSMVNSWPQVLQLLGR
ncbi:acyl-CoA thioesterase/BAAT N-terminal domain-containing protein [Streptomyces sp. NPDC093586]|uniref:acyl-CoA thioesterase/BAAT N-terminal domain-containing protein n=1 Tax=Streptomyces sp. NPDC093586 TaxID=3366042 RepID=UPI00382876C6